MKFSSAVITSVIFHLGLVLVAYFYPEGVSSNETTYYVDLVQVGGSPPGQTSSLDRGVDSKEKSISIKDLSTSTEKKPELTYPDKESKSKSIIKKKKDELVSVIKRKSPVKNVDQSEETSGSEDRGYLRTGLSGGTGQGTAGSGMNFPYSFYVETLKSKITSNWYNPLSSSGISGRFLAVVYFRIYRNGTIGKLELVKKSANRYYDLSTLRVIKEVIPFPPLPSDYPEQYLGVYFEFEWER